MGLKEFFIEKKSSILERWFQLILETYPAETSKLIGQSKDRFSDPVGYTLTHALEAFYDGLLEGKAAEQWSVHLDRIIQIRSVQDFSPSRAVAIVPLVKRAILEEVKRNGIEFGPLIEEWFEFESRVDQLSLIAFDSYSGFRDRVYEIRINEMRKERDRAVKLLERSGLKLK